MKFECYREGSRASEGDGTEEIYIFAKKKDGSYYVSTKYHSMFFDEAFVTEFLKYAKDPMDPNSKEFKEEYGELE